MRYRIGVLALIMVALPISANAQKQNNQKSPAHLPSWQIERIVPKGEKRTLVFFNQLNPDCTPVGTIVAKLTGKPRSGTVTFEKIEAFPNFTTEDYKKCNSKKVPGTVVIYEPNPDFTGTDTFSGTAIYFGGQARKFEVNVSVEPISASGKKVEVSVEPPISANAQKQNDQKSPAHLPSWQIERIVPKGEKRRLLFVNILNPDCTSKGAIIAKLTGEPKSGTVTFEETEDFANQTAEDYKKCNSKKVPGTAVSYEPNQDFTGADRFSGTIISIDGRAREFEIKVSVEPPISASAANGTMPNNEPHRIKTLAVKGDAAENGGVPAGAQKVGPPISANAQEQKKVDHPAFLPSMQVERVVPKGEKRRIGFRTSLNPDCTSKGAIIVRLTGMPKSGTVTFGEIEDFPNMTAEDYKKCNTGKVPGTAVSYEPNPDFTGTDTFGGTEIYPNGQARKFEVKVSVE